MLSVDMGNGDEIPMDRLNEAIESFASQTGVKSNDVVTKIAEIVEKLAVIEALKKRYDFRYDPTMRRQS